MDLVCFGRHGAFDLIANPAPTRDMQEVQFRPGMGPPVEVFGIVGVQPSDQLFDDETLPGGARFGVLLDPRKR